MLQRERAWQVRVLAAAVGLQLAIISPAQTGTALVRRAPTLNGTVEGSIHQMTAENTTLNGSAKVTGDILIPGTPTVQLNGNPVYGGTVDGSGAAVPNNYKVTLNGGAWLGHLIRRTDAIPWPTVAAPPQPTGTRSVSLNHSSQSPGDFATLKNLTLNSNLGLIAVPSGTYGNFIANSGSGFTLGLAGTTEPAVYHFQNLTLNSNSTFTVVGPVVVTLNGGFSTNTSMGASQHPEWLKIYIAGGGMSLASNRTVYAHLEAPAGTLTLNGGSQFIGAVTTDRLIVNSNGVLRLIAPPDTSDLPFMANFEPADGYQPGPLDGQQGWAVTGSATVGTELRYAGSQGIAVAPAASAALLVRAFANDDPRATFVDLFALPAAATTADAGVFFETDAAQVALTGLNGLGTLHAFQGDGAGGGVWWATGTGPALDATGRSAEWLRLTVRTDYVTKKWDLYFNGRMIAADLGFVNNTASAFTGLGLSGHSSLVTGFDDLLIAFDNPLFIDADGDGMDDSWETAHGLNPGINDRDDDLDADGLTNIQEHLLGTNPNSADPDGDGLSDAVEISLGTNPGRADTDGDGLPDGWEITHGLNPLAAADASLDPDGDGLTNLQEFRQGTDPAGYFNGQLPTFTSLLAADGSLGPDDTLNLLVTDAFNQPLVNAPVTFTAKVGGHLLATNFDGAVSTVVTVRTGPDGIARVYVKKGGN